MAHSDEEALDALLEAEQSAHVSTLQHAPRKGMSLLVSALVVSCVGVAYLCFPSTSQRTAVQLPAGGFEEKASIADSAVEPQEAVKRSEKRQRLGVEQDLKSILHEHVSHAGRQAHYRHQQSAKGGAGLCFEHAERLFDQVMSSSTMHNEFHEKELSAFKDRFSVAMTMRCKDLQSEQTWIEAAGQELEMQKPLMTSAVAASLNEAGLGFKTKMHDWLAHESASSFSSRLGLLPTPEGQKDVLKRGPQREASPLPHVFRAELKWPQCREEILKIHNQGHCGSCWAFGGLASIDARMCIASGGGWDAPQDILSRLHVTSCAPDQYEPGHDGCQGGWPHWPMEMMARVGVASTSCLPYYIAGEGAEHFQHQDTAPPCESHCQGGYSLGINNDTYSSAGVANYDWLTQVHGDPTKIGAMKEAIYQEGPVAFAFKANHDFMGYHSGVFSVCTGHERANHAVYAFGWGVVASEGGQGSVEYLEASNSWGTNWGANGHFRIHPRCITDVTIPGTIESTVVGHQVGTVDPNKPRDPDNELWPWPKPNECPVDDDGCVTDMEVTGNYSANEKCVSKALNGKSVRVEQFDMEYGYDILYVNNKAFSGWEGFRLDLDTLTSLVVDDEGIKFQSDSSLQRSGFKLCAA